MIQLKATCLRCKGIGYDPANTENSDACSNCEEKGVLILDDRNWEISIERVPPFSSEEVE